FFQAEDGIRDRNVTGVQTCALPIFIRPRPRCGSAIGGLSSERSNRQRVAPSAPPKVRRASVLARGCSERGVQRRLVLEPMLTSRSEERRVGKEWRSTWAAHHDRKGL